MMQAMSAPVTFKISDEVRDVLARSTVTATSVTLPPGQLDRKLYEAVNKALVGAGGKWDRKAGAHVFVRDPREVLGLAVETGKAVNVKTTLQAFYTPESLAERVVRAVGIAEDERVVQARAGRAFGRPLALEPSVGDGALAVALIKAAGGHVFLTSCDIDPVATAAAKPRIVAAYREAKQSAELAASVATQVHTHDFLKTSLKDSVAFDYVVMNPPFKGGPTSSTCPTPTTSSRPAAPSWRSCGRRGRPRPRRRRWPSASSWRARHRPMSRTSRRAPSRTRPSATVMLTLRKGS
jgi:hypothetical protein